MIFLGYAIYGGEHSAEIRPTDITDIKKVSMQNIIVDGFYITEETDNKAGQTIPNISEWTFDTILNAPFNGNLLGGNVNFTADQILCMRVKRAEIDSYKWITLYEIPINSNEDLDFTRLDMIARGNQEYKYALVPVWNDSIEGNYNINTVKSDFDGLWIVEKEMSVNALIELGMNTTRNMTTSTVVPLGRKYPYVNQYGKTNYTSGRFDAMFINLNYEDCSLEIENGVKYREIVEDFLTDGHPKIIKHMDGRIWLVAITDTIPKNEGNDYRLPVQTVNFVEIGKHDSSTDLYDANIIDVNIESEVIDDGVLSYSV